VLGGKITNAIFREAILGIFRLKNNRIATIKTLQQILKQTQKASLVFWVDKMRLESAALFANIKNPDRKDISFLSFFSISRRCVCSALYPDSVATWLVIIITLDIVAKSSRSNEMLALTSLKILTSRIIRRFTLSGPQSCWASHFQVLWLVY